MTKSRNYYKRNLPHWHPAGKSFFLTWRLQGSLPQTVINQMRIARQRLRMQQKSDHEGSRDARLREYKKLFARADAILDRGTTGPLWLKVKEIASRVQEALLERYAHLYTLWAYVVMANHVHVFLKPKGEATVERITKYVKGSTAREANLLLGRTGQKFWQDESFDHWCRDRDEFSRIVKYVENNPVKAGLVKKPEDWPWSSAAERKRRGWSDFRALT
jgi:putative transposase